MRARNLAAAGLVTGGLLAGLLPAAATAAAPPTVQPPTAAIPTVARPVTATIPIPGRTPVITTRSYYKSVPKVPTRVPGYSRSDRTVERVRLVGNSTWRWAPSRAGTAAGGCNVQMWFARWRNTRGSKGAKVQSALAAIPNGKPYVGKKSKWGGSGWLAGYACDAPVWRNSDRNGIAEIDVEIVTFWEKPNI